MLKGKFSLTDRQLNVGIKAAKYAEWWCASGVAFWGVIALAGLAVIGLQAVGIGIPAVIGVSTIVMGGLMAAKSVVLQQGCRALYNKAVKTRDERLKAKGLPPAPVPVSLLSKLSGKPGMQTEFNYKAALEQVRDTLKKYGLTPKPPQKTATRNSLS